MAIDLAVHWASSELRLPQLRHLCSFPGTAPASSFLLFPVKPLHTLSLAQTTGLFSHTLSLAQSLCVCVHEGEDLGARLDLGF